MLVIGLTGGIGSGKTTVAHLFQEKGIAVIDTDQLSRDLTQPHQPALEKIIRHFGEAILSSDKTLNRAALRKIIFEDARQKKWLEALLHPLIRQKIAEEIQRVTSAYSIVVIPLLFETKKNPLIDRILVVDAPEETQWRRSMQRDHATEAEVKAILNTQVSRAIRLAGADDIIENNHTVNTLIFQVEKLHERYLKIASKNSM